MNVELLYLAWNRLEFTQASFATVFRHTDWSKISRLVIYDDSSKDGTAEFLEMAGRAVPVPAFDFRRVSFSSPAATMNDYLALTEADAFVKIDNDIAVPSGYLRVLLKMAADHPDYELIGMEAGQNSPPEAAKRQRNFKVQVARHIGGVGLMRTSAFIPRPPIPASLGKHNRDGFTIWQYRQHPTVGWVVPDPPVVQLDRIPEDPWASLRREYIAHGWQREWPFYDETGRPWWAWLDNFTFDWSAVLEEEVA